MRSHAAPPSSRPTFWDSFLLRSAERAVAGLSIEQSRNVTELFDAAARLHTSAHDMLDGDRAGLAMDLAARAALLYVRAILASRVSPLELSGLTDEQAWARFDALVEEGALPHPSEGFDDARAIFADVPSWNRLSVESGLGASATVVPALDWLRSQVGPRSLSELRHRRHRRLLVCAAAVAALSSWGARAAFAPRNLALHQPVRASSVHPQSIAPPDGLVDGLVDQGYGVHTAADSPPWVVVDLGSVRKVTRVKLYNRTDCCFDASLPLYLEFSEDGSTFVEVAQRATSFNQFFPWVFSSEGRPTRYVRVRGNPGAVVVLGELEVNGD